MRFLGLILTLAVLAIAAAAPLHAEDAVNRALYVVSYFEVAPAAAAQSADLARQYAAASRNQGGNAAFDIFQEIGRPSRFAIVEAWHDKKAAEAHGGSAETGAFRSKLRPLLVTALDMRPSGGLTVAAPAGSDGPEAVYVLTHVDVVPAGKEEGIAFVKELAEAGRKDAGNIRFDVLQQDSRPNHFTLVEAWRDRNAFDASVTAPHTKDFRQKLTPLSGALYDERLYRAVR